MDIAALLLKAQVLIPALLIVNVVLSSISQVLVILHKQDIPVLSQIAAGLKKVVDFLSANQAH